MLCLSNYLLQALRSNAKNAAAATTSLVAAARTAATAIDNDPESAPLLAAAKAAADVIAKLIKPLQDAQKAPEASTEALNNLLNASKQVRARIVPYVRTYMLLGRSYRIQVSCRLEKRCASCY